MEKQKCIYLAFHDNNGRNFGTQVCLSETSALDWLYKRWLSNVTSTVELYRATLDENNKVVRIEKAIQLFTDSKTPNIEWKASMPETKRILKREIEQALSKTNRG